MASLQVFPPLDLPKDVNLLLLAYSPHDEGLLKKYQGEVRVLQAEQHGDIANFSSESFGAVVSFPSLPFSGPYLEHILRVLKPSGSFVMRVPNSQVDYEQGLLFAGFVDVKTDSTNSSSTLSCKKPAWKAGASVSFQKKSVERKKPATKSDTSSLAWNLALDDLLDEDVVMKFGAGDLEDEDALLLQDTVDVTQLRAGYAECGSTGQASRRACKNCTCGRAEQEAKGATQDSAPVSACGSCGLGDAFRCSGCPYLGMPAFKMKNGKPVFKSDSSNVVKLQL